MANQWLSGSRNRALAAPLALTAVVLLAAGWLSGPWQSRERATARPTTPVNASLETDANHDGVPDCWSRSKRGVNAGSYTWTRSSHAGGRAETVNVTTWSSGARSLQTAKSSACFLRVSARHVYRFGTWYRGHGDLHLIVSTRAPDGAWHRWVSSPRLSPVTTYRHIRFDTPSMPLGTTGVVFALELRSVGAVSTDAYSLQDEGPAPTSHAHPPSAGYFGALVAPSQWRTLPGDATCAGRVHRSTWEPRRANTGRNHLLLDPAAVHASFRARPRSGDGSYAERWDSWLLPRVDGQFTGTTDEIIQWAACKWGLPDNYLRAEADAESTWFQYQVYRNGACVNYYGCGDFFDTEPAAPRNGYCAGLAQVGGYDYQKDYGKGQCPKTFSIVGIMSWWNPDWGYHWALHQSGTFPFTRDSTAMAVDYMASQIRGCFQGWEWQLGTAYHAGDLWGCAGAWFSGNWHDSEAERYIGEVKTSLSKRVWLAAKYPLEHGPCRAQLGCPVPG